VSCGGLHIGKVFYGNIGRNERLDFTVVGPSINEVARITETCRSTERDVPPSEVPRESIRAMRGHIVPTITLRRKETAHARRDAF
jgi:adenylate cyclase